jgi:hypothetical protein
MYSNEEILEMINSWQNKKHSKHSPQSFEEFTASQR